MIFDAQKSRANFCRFELRHIYIDAIEVSMQMIRQHPEDGFEKFYKEFTKNEMLAALQDMLGYVDALNEIDRLTDIVRQVKTREITNEEFDDWWKDIESVEKNELAKKWHTAYRKAQNSNLVRKQQNEHNKICKNCMFFETYFANWAPTDMCEHVIYTGPSLLYGGPDEARGLYVIEHVRYNEKLCGKSGRWYVERPRGFDKLPYDERQKIRKQNE